MANCDRCRNSNEAAPCTNGCSFDEPLPIEGSLGLSTAVYIHEQDSASVAGKLTEGGVEVESERVAISTIYLIL
jgi:hypothetical protein